MSFPGQQGNQQTQFLNGLSEQRPYLRRNETRNIVIALRIPQNTFVGTNKTITLEVQPDGVAGLWFSILRLVYMGFFSCAAQSVSTTLESRKHQKINVTDGLSKQDIRKCFIPGLTSCEGGRSKSVIVQG